jgi:hypothetical protein
MAAILGSTPGAFKQFMASLAILSESSGFKDTVSSLVVTLEGGSVNALCVGKSDKSVKSSCHESK